MFPQVDNTLHFLIPFTSAPQEGHAQLTTDTKTTVTAKSVFNNLFQTCSRITKNIGTRLVATIPYTRDFVCSYLNHLPKLAAHHGVTGSFTYRIGEGRATIGYINGIAATIDDALASTRTLSEEAGDLSVEMVYNASTGIYTDIAECIIGHTGVHFPPVYLLQKQWEEFAVHHPDGKYLQICHSGGAIHVKNALLASPQELRDRIVVVAIAPGAIIPNELCHASHNYVVEGRDFVPHLDVLARIWSGHYSQLQYVPPITPDRLQHDFLHDSFEEIIRTHIQTHLANIKS